MLDVAGRLKTAVYRFPRQDMLDVVDDTAFGAEGPDLLRAHLTEFIVADRQDDGVVGSGLRGRNGIDPVFMLGFFGIDPRIEDVDPGIVGFASRRRYRPPGYCAGPGSFP